MDDDYDDRSTDANESTTTPHSRRDMLKLAGTVGAASLGATTFVETASAASEAQSDQPAAESPETDATTPNVEQRSDEVEALASVNPSCVWKSGSPGATIYGGNCAEHAYANSDAYAAYIRRTYPGLANCRSQDSIAREITLHEYFDNGGSITIGCSWK